MIKKFVLPVVVLTVITLVISVALAFTYQLTEPIINAGNQAAADAAKLIVLPNADGFVDIDVTGIEGVSAAVQATNGAGFVFTTSAKGFAGDIVIMVGIDPNGVITGVTQLDGNETPGIGTQVAEEAYTSQYVGQDSSLAGVSAISGATVSSTAFHDAVSIAFNAYAALEGGEFI